PIGRCHEGGVPEPTTTPGDGHHLLTGFDQVGDHDPVIIEHDSSQGNGKDEVLSLATVAEIALTVGPGLGSVVGVPLVAEKGGDRWVSPEDHRAADTTIPTDRFAVGSACGTNECGNTGTTVASTEVDPDGVNEHAR